MPSGRVRWYDEKKGFGFIDSDMGDVFLPASALPDGVRTVKKGARVQFSMADGRKGPQALSLTIDKPLPSVVKATRPSADDMVAIVEDLIKILDKTSDELRRHRYPSGAEAKRLATMLRAVADDFDVEE